MTAGGEESMKMGSGGPKTGTGIFCRKNGRWYVLPQISCQNGDYCGTIGPKGAVQWKKTDH